MPGPKPSVICLEHNFQQELQTLIRRHTTPQQIAVRAKIILLAHQGGNNQDIARKLGIGPDMVRYWRGRWKQLQPVPLPEMSVLSRLTDAPRPGAPPTISAEAYCQIMALACQPPENYDRPITHWTERELAEEAIEQGIVATISPRQVGRFLKGGRPQAAPKPLLADLGARPR